MKNSPFMLVGVFSVNNSPTLLSFTFKGFNAKDYEKDFFSYVNEVRDNILNAPGHYTCEFICDSFLDFLTRSIRRFPDNISSINLKVDFDIVEEVNDNE